MTPDLRVPVAADWQAGMIERVRAAWNGFPQLSDRRRADRNARRLGPGAEFA